MQTDYIMSRPQGNPSGAALLPLSLDTNNQMSYDGTKSPWQCQRHLYPEGRRCNQACLSSPPPSPQALAQRATHPTRAHHARFKDPPRSRGLLTTGGGRGTVPARWTPAHSSSFHTSQCQSKGLLRQVSFHGWPEIPSPEKHSSAPEKPQL